MRSLREKKVIYLNHYDRVQCNITVALYYCKTTLHKVNFFSLKASSSFGRVTRCHTRAACERRCECEGWGKKGELATISYKFSFPPSKLQGVKTVTGNKKSQCFFFFFEETDLPHTYLDININTLTLLSFCVGTHKHYTGAPNDNFQKSICSEDDLRSRIFRTFAVKFLACLPLLGFSNI